MFFRVKHIETIEPIAFNLHVYMCVIDLHHPPTLRPPGQKSRSSQPLIKTEMLLPVTHKTFTFSHTLSSQGQRSRSLQAPIEKIYLALKMNCFHHEY